MKGTYAVITEVTEVLMRKIIIFISTIIFILGIGLSGIVSAQETTGEKWKKEKKEKIDKEAADKKNKAREDAETSTKWGHGSQKNEADKAQKIKEADAKIDAEAEQKKKEVDKTYDQLGPAKDKPNKGKK